MFGDQPEKIPEAEAAESIFGSREKEKLEHVYKTQTNSSGESIAHEAARTYCNKDNEEGCEIPPGSSPEETARVIGFMVSMRSDLMPNVLDDHISDGQEELAYHYLGKCAMENGDH